MYLHVKDCEIQRGLNRPAVPEAACSNVFSQTWALTVNRMNHKAVLQRTSVVFVTRAKPSVGVRVDKIVKSCTCFSSHFSPPHSLIVEDHDRGLREITAARMEQSFHSCTAAVVYVMKVLVYFLVLNFKRI